MSPVTVPLPLSPVPRRTMVRRYQIGTIGPHTSQQPGPLIRQLPPQTGSARCPHMTILATSDLLKEAARPVLCALVYRNPAAGDTKSGSLANDMHTATLLHEPKIPSCAGTTGLGDKACAGRSRPRERKVRGVLIGPSEVLTLRGTTTPLLITRFVASPGTPGCSRRLRRGT
jgi:hypothetical protein